MKQNARQILNKLLAVIMAGVAGIGFATAATAAGVGVGAGTNVGAGAQAGGNADAQLNAPAIANANAQLKSGATRGEDGAAERLGTNGDGLEHATTAKLGAAANAKPLGTH
jgi:hypothetical protein